MNDVLQDAREAVANVVGYHMAAVVSGNNQPCMSGDPRDRIGPGKRRWFDDACRGAADAAIAALRACGWGPNGKAMEGALRAAEGYLLNAKIDLETGCPKRVAIGTIEGGIKRVREALSAAPEPPA